MNYRTPEDSPKRMGEREIEGRERKQIAASKKQVIVSTGQEG